MQKCETERDANTPVTKKGKGRPKNFDRGEALRAALKLFWEKGFEPTTVAGLCQAMGVNPPSLYCCFGNKAALFIEAARHYEQAHWAEPTARFMAEPDIYKAVADYFDAAARILLSPDTPCGCMAALGAVNISPNENEVIESIRSMRLATQKMFSDRLERAIADGQLPADTDAPTVASSLNTFLEGLSLLARDEIFLARLRDVAASAIRLLPSEGKIS